jgi:predicted enzyme related to lactoylglutathione lyase
MKTKLEPRSLLIGALAGAVAVLCAAAATKETAEMTGGATGDTIGKENEVRTEHVTGIGGVFFKAKDPKAMLAWYREHLGIDAKGGYIDFTWREKDHPQEIGHTAWRIFPMNSAYFGQATSPLMINYRVANLDRMLKQLRRSGVNIEKVENYNYGGFAWITDPEGNRIELWEPRKK